MKGLLSGVARSLYAGWLSACLIVLYGGTIADLRVWLTIIPTIVLVTIINQNSQKL